MVYVAALGASTPVGRDCWSSAAAVRAGISGFVEHPSMIDSAGEPMRVAMAPWLNLECEGARRFQALLLPALTQSVAPLTASARQLRVGLAIGLPAQRPGFPVRLEMELRSAIAAHFPERFSAVAFFAVGHAAGLLGLHAAFAKMQAGALDACVIAGVESYLSAETLEWLEESDQLHGAGRLNNAWGFIPGEAAGAVLVVTKEALNSIGIEPLARVLSVGCSIEPNSMKSATVCVGEGLTAAFRESLLGLPPGALVSDVFCDMNGEPYRADEFGFACLRTREAFVSASDFIAPADCWGDVSAASAPLNITLSTIAAKKAYAAGSYSLIWASSESGERGAVLLEFPPVGRQ